MTGRERCFGKYRGTCVSTADPSELGRIQVQVPDVRGAEILGWAMPCVPYAGDGVGLLVRPPVGAAVWVEFERGDPDLPIWVGGYWREGEVPAAVADPTGDGLAVHAGAGVTVAVTGSGVVIDGGAGASITVSGSTVEIRET